MRKLLILGVVMVCLLAGGAWAEEGAAEDVEEGQL